MSPFKWLQCGGTVLHCFPVAVLCSQSGFGCGELLWDKFGVKLHYFHSEKERERALFRPTDGIRQQ